MHKYLDKYAVTFQGRIVMMLNPQLVEEKCLSDENLKELKALHAIRFALFETMAEETEKNTLRKYCGVLEALEFKMQEAWGFPQDRNFHSWWVQAPHCSCSESNLTHFIGKGRLINPDCILHGD